MLEAGLESGTTLLASAVRLLVVDDDELVCRQMASSLAHAGYHVVTALDADGAIAQATLTPPDVAIVDLNMPVTSGAVVIQHLKRVHGAAVHVIALTGNDDEGHRAEAFDAGADDYIVKPVSMVEVRRRIAAAIRTQREFVQVRLEKEATERRLVYGQEALALLAHDLNNGLAVALSNLAYLIEVIKGDPEQTEALAATLRSVRRMSGLVANFVDISRFEDAAVKPAVQLTRVRQLLESVVEVNASSATREIKFAIDCPMELEGRFDGGLIERVLHNLIGNAVRYCNHGGTIRVSAKRWHDPDASIELSVMNTGPQVTEAIRANLFEKYVRGKGGRRGMGLYFCRLIADAHGGKISCEPHPDGPSFVLRLPGHA